MSIRLDQVGLLLYYIVVEICEQSSMFESHIHKNRQKLFPVIFLSVDLVAILLSNEATGEDL